MAKIGTNKTVGQPKSGTMRVANATSSGFGIIYADEIIGHRRVDTFEDLAKIPNWALYDQAGGADISTAKGQLWYVSGDSKLYQLTGIDATGANRTWTEFKGTGTSYTLPVMTTGTLGGAKLVSDITQTTGANPVTTTVNRTYAVQKNTYEQLVVNVPWIDTNNNTTYTFANGTDGSFTVTPSNGTAKKVSIGKPTSAGHADTATNAINATNADKATKDSKNNVIAETYATKSEISALTSALVYKGTVNESSDLPTINVKVGDVYVVATAGIYAGQSCEPGDMIIAKVGGNAPEWTIIQTSISGAVTTDNVLHKNNIILGNGQQTLTQLEPSAGYLYWDGKKYVWKTPEEFNLKPASPTALGGIKIGFTQTSKKYPVQLGTGADADKAFVEVPWTDTKYALPVAKDGVLGGIRTDYNTTGKNYAVKTDTDGKAYVSVPWTDTNTTYTSGTGIIINGNTISWAHTPYSKLKHAFDDDFAGYLINVSKTDIEEGVHALSYLPGTATESVEIIKIYDYVDNVADGLASIKALRSAASNLQNSIQAVENNLHEQINNVGSSLNNKVNTADKITEADINALFTNN